MTLRSRQVVLSTARVVLLGTALGLAVPRPVSALNIERCVSQDNHLYVIMTTGSDSYPGDQRGDDERQRQRLLRACRPGRRAHRRWRPAAGSLLPNRMRTTVISGLPSNAVTCAAQLQRQAAGGQGQLTLPGGATVSVQRRLQQRDSRAGRNRATWPCRPPSTCRRVSRSVPGCSVSGETMVVPLDGRCVHAIRRYLGEQASQTVTYDDTEGSTVGNRAPGNNVPPTQAIGGRLPPAGRLHQSRDLPGHRVHRHPGRQHRRRRRGGRLHDRFERDHRRAPSAPRTTSPSTPRPARPRHADGDARRRRRRTPRRQRRPTTATATATANGTNTHDHRRLRPRATGTIHAHTDDHADADAGHLPA